MVKAAGNSYSLSPKVTAPIFGSTGFMLFMGFSLGSLVLNRRAWEGIAFRVLKGKVNGKG